MSIEARREYLRAIWERYQKGRRKERYMLAKLDYEIMRLQAWQ